MKDKKGYIKWVVFLVINTIMGFLWFDSGIYLKLSKLNIYYKVPLIIDFLPTIVLSVLFSITDKVNLKRKLINSFIRIIIGIFLVYVVLILYFAQAMSNLD